MKRFLTHKFKTRLNNQKGMTLIEIMIVLAIIGSIMALLLPRLTGAQVKANIKESKIKMGQIVGALQMYQTDCGHFPSSLAGLVAADAGCTNWGPEPYLKLKKGEDTIKDLFGHEYGYELSGSEYKLTFYGRDGAPGGSGYDADITSDDL